MVSETIKKLMSDCKILFTNIEDLMDDREQDKRRIKYLTEECKDLKKLYEAKLQVQKTSYHELYDQLRNLQARCSHIQRRETEAMAESYRRFEEWKKKLSSS
jgi:chromosome segregation ATPase